VRIRLDDELCARIEAFSRRCRVTPHMTLRALFEALVHRLTGRERFVVGCGVANRRTPALESVVGMVLNNVALPADLSGAPDLETLLARVRDTAVAALDHQDVPFDRVVAAVDPERSPGRSPLCQVFFSSYDGPLPELELRDVRVEPCFGLNNGSAKFDLNVIVAAVPTTPPGGPAGASRSRPSRSIEMIWEYSTDLFERETIERWTAWFVTLLDAALQGPSRPIHALPLMSPAEREQVLVAWNRTATEYPRDATLHELFENVARRTPEHPALVAGDQVITYRELDRRANQFAAYLAGKGVGAGARVGLCLERSPDAIAAILGTLKAGAAYVPLDPSDPPDRRALLVREASLDIVHGDTGCEALTDGPGPTPRLADAAYVMFTSGSAGPPKGVVVTHRNVVRLVRGTDYATLGPGEVLLQMAPLTFDASTFEIWGALANGAPLVLWPDREIDLGALGRVVEQHHVTTLWLTASLLHAVVRTRLQALAGLRQLLAGGDVLQPDDVARVRQAYPDLRIVNGYGPTEATTFSCCYVVPPGPVSEGSIPIGRPIANTTAYVLDDRLEPAPIGVPGELFIGGDGVSPGYVNAPDLTAQRFLPDPWSDRGGRLYRTGDRVRWRADGQLEFLGRIDRQVKVRGYRVEPAELETVIASLPDVRDVAVTTPEDPAGGRRLHAFVVANGEVPVAGLRAALASRLPGYMIPSGFTVLDHLPMTSGGKTDYASLPPPEAAREDVREVTMPRDELESTLLEIWELVLGRTGIGTLDDFFDLGGHSLLAMQVTARIEERLGVTVPLQRLFDAPTVAALARVVEESAESDRPAPIARQPRRAAAASPRQAEES
jgi:amino acid adenylation domain-containing protein